MRSAQWLMAQPIIFKWFAAICSNLIKWETYIFKFGLLQKRGIYWLYKVGITTICKQKFESRIYHGQC